MQPNRPDQLEVGVTYWPADVGPYLWHEFHPATVIRDLTAIASRRIPVVRVMLSWDVFMPSDRAPNGRRMRDLETLLNAARDVGIRVVITLFAQSLGDCVMLPAYAIDRRAPRPGVRCLTDARAVDGGPRDIYADPLMIEVQVRWLDAMLAGFAHHPAIAAWDIGHDPATTIRPRRIAEMAAWAALLAQRVHAQEEQCRLTLGQDDVVRGRGVRLAAIAEHVDVLGLAIRPQRLNLSGERSIADSCVFVLQLAEALAGSGVPLIADIGIASGGAGLQPAADAPPAEAVTSAPDDARRDADRVLGQMLSSGVAGLHCAAWSDWGERLIEAPPGDRSPWLARLGIVDSIGQSKPMADVWDELAGSERGVGAATPYPTTIDVESYYANLPDSLLDLYSAWQGDRSDHPAILD